MANETYRKQFQKIRTEVGKMANDFSKGLAREASQDLAQVHEEIINHFYDSHDPSSYNRSYGLYDSLTQHPVTQVGDKKHLASITVGSESMQNYYNIDKDNVFDLMWNKGVRGLPKFGTRTLDNGDKWVNPYWNIEVYHNVFLTSVTLGSYTSKTGVPHQVMEDITLNWEKAKGIDTCNRLYDEIKNRYDK